MERILLAIVLLVLVGVGYLVYKDISNKGETAATASSFKEDESKYATDLIGRSVSLPQAQLWGFNWDQQITVAQVNKKVLDDNLVVVVVEIKAIAKLQPLPESQQSKEKAPQVKELKMATLAGYMKLLYERVNGQWYLTNTEGISLKVTAE